MSEESELLPNALTIDMEEWFCVSAFEPVIRREDWPKLESRIESATLTLLELLDRYGVKATFFVLGWIAERHEALIRRIAAKGHELASHGYEHRLVYDLKPAAFHEDVARSLEILRRISGSDCIGYRAPSFSMRREMDWAWRSLAELGVRYDSSIYPVAHDRYGEPAAPRFPFWIESSEHRLLEIPPSTVRLLGRNLPVAGGGYLRLYPLRATRWAIKRINNEGFPAIIYLHPWELDPGHPVPAAPRPTVLRHRVGIKSVPRKLDALLREFRFCPMKQLFETMTFV
jgi:polysaccharide deacetylase family protein (PEP-CTERM system associated)